LRFLIGNALPPRLAALLVAAGHDAAHVRAYGMQAAADEEILARALDEDRIVVSADSDERGPTAPASTAPALELPILHLGAMGAFHRRDIYDDAR
jgi:predicted nuclease of predicted toxin-antitoxin system